MALVSQHTRPMPCKDARQVVVVDMKENNSEVNGLHSFTEEASIYRLCYVVSGTGPTMDDVNI